MVWEAARPAPRAIKPIRSKDGVSYYPPTPIPAMLHTCHNCRKVASKWYQLRLTSLTSPLFARPRIFFDVEHDFYYIHFVGTCGESPIDRIEIRNVAAETFHPRSLVNFFSVGAYKLSYNQNRLPARTDTTCAPHLNSLYAYEFDAGRPLRTLK